MDGNLIIVAVIGYIGYRQWRKRNPKTELALPAFTMPKLTRPAKPARAQAALDSDDPFLDSIEQQHNRAAQQAMLAVHHNDQFGAVRHYATAAAYASVLFEATGDPMWQTAMSSSRLLSAQAGQAPLALDEPTPISRPRPAPAAAPVAAPVQDDEREVLVAKFMKQHKFDRAMAEQIVDQHLARARVPA